MASQVECASVSANVKYWVMCPVRLYLCQQLSANTNKGKREKEERENKNQKVHKGKIISLHACEPNKKKKVRGNSKTMDLDLALHLSVLFMKTSKAEGKHSMSHWR